MQEQIRHYLLLADTFCVDPEIEGDARLVVCTWILCVWIRKKKEQNKQKGARFFLNNPTAVVELRSHVE